MRVRTKQQYQRKCIERVQASRKLTRTGRWFYLLLTLGQGLNRISRWSDE